MPSRNLARWRKLVSPRQQRDDSSPLELGTWPRTVLPECRVHACVCTRPAPSRSVPSRPVSSRSVPSRIVSCGAGCPAAHPSRVYRERGTTEWLAEIGGRGVDYQWNTGCHTRDIVPTVGSAVSITVNQPRESARFLYILRSSSAKGSLYSIRLAKNFTCVYWYFSSKELK